MALLDDNRPDGDGRELLLEIRGTPAYRRFPVVVLTTSMSPRDRSAFDEAGAGACHGKDVRFDRCLETLAGIFRCWLSTVLLPDPPTETG